MPDSVLRLLAEAKNAAGDQAVRAARTDHHSTAASWSDLAVRLDGLLREAVDLMAKRGESVHA